MIGGEFDLSAGVAVTSAALTASLFSYEFTTNAWVGVLVALAVALFIGFLNGWIVVKTGHPELPGHAGHVLHAPGPEPGAHPDHHQPGVQPGHLHPAGLRLGAEGVLGQLDHRRGDHQDHAWSTGSSSSSSRPGSCCAPTSATGSSPSAATPAAARAVGVPVGRMKIGLFMAVGFMAWFTGMHTLFLFNTIQSGTGHRQRVRLHHRGGRRRLPADRRLRLGGRRGDRRADLRHGQPGHRLRRLEPRLVHSSSSARCCSARSC